MYIKNNDKKSFGMEIKNPYTSKYVQDLSSFVKV